LFLGHWGEGLIQKWIQLYTNKPPKVYHLIY